MSNTGQPNIDAVIDNHELSFDVADKRNGSLYVCEPRGLAGTIMTQDLLAALRKSELWSDDEPTSVPDEQRNAYKEQLTLVETAPYKQEEVGFLIARFDHPRYPSDGERWDAWKGFFDARFEQT